MAEPSARWQGVALALVTQHGKERVIAPALASIGAALHHVEGVNTDALGTFTREIPRAGTQVEAARRKAELAAERSGLRYGLGSEGAFGPDPYGVLPWNLEIIVLLDAETGHRVVGRAAGPALHHHAAVADWPALRAFAEEAGFPEHALVLRADDERGPVIHKGVAGWEALEQGFVEAVAASSTGLAFVEHDLRAHLHPTRMARVAEAAADLARRMASPCPVCAAPGFALAGRVLGLPCQWCGAPSNQARAERWACEACAHEEERPIEGPTHADPGTCPRCNP